MATISRLPGRTSPIRRLVDDRVARLMSLLDPDHRPGTGIDGLSEPRGDEYGFNRLIEMAGPGHAAHLDELKPLLDSKRMQRRSAANTAYHLRRLIQLGYEVGIDPFDCSAAQGLELLEAFRAQGGARGGQMGWRSCNNARRQIVLLHLVAGLPDPFTDDTENALRLIDSWARQDRSALGGRPGSNGVPGRELTEAIGYSTATPINIGHVARMNVRKGGSLDRLLLREQVRVLLVRETFASCARLARLGTNDVELGRQPGVWIEVRADGTGGQDRHPISVEMARLLRLLIEDVCAGHHGPPWPDVPVFQQLCGGRWPTWQGPLDGPTEWALRSMLRKAEAQARQRRENDIGDPVAVAMCIDTATYEGVRDGLVLDCWVAGVPAMGLANFLRRRSPNEILSLYEREDDRSGRNRIGRGH